MAESFLDQIHEQSLEILREVGLMIPDQLILKRLGKEGFPVNSMKMTIQFPLHLIESALKSIGPQISLFGRQSSSRGLALDGETKFMTSGTGVGILDALTNLRRESQTKDIENLVKIQHSLDHVDIVRSMVTAADYPPDFSDLVEFYYLFKHTTKPFLHRTLHPDNVRIVLEMARVIAGGTSALRGKPNFGVVYCPRLLFPSQERRFSRCSFMLSKESLC